jgi:5-methylcytosine-specific restriction endonuclease McrA
MSAPLTEPRPCERQCSVCENWKHHSRFRAWKEREARNRSVSRFSPVCRSCEQIARNERKNADRPLAVIKARAAVAASKAGVAREFFWMQMNYRALVPEYRAMITDEGLCKNCGHGFVSERDIQIEHIEPPRSNTDWARLHARNLRLFCGSCNGTKGHKSFPLWLDEQEDSRISNLQELTELKQANAAPDLFAWADRSIA